jgi:NitT/TauT family transport system substrate-binding protein
VDGSYLPLKIAEDAKLFEKHGLEANVTLIRGGSTMMQALLAGEVAAAFIGGTSVILSRAAGADVKMVLGLSNALVYQIVAGPHLQGKATRIEDLRGKRVAISNRGAESESVVRLALQKYKVSPSEVTFLQIGESGERLAALKAGTADATPLPSPQHLRAVKAGFPVVMDVTKEQLEWLHAGVAMKESWARREPRVADALVKTFVEATFYGWANKTFSKRALAKYIKSEDDEVLEQGYRDFLEHQAKDLRPSRAGTQAAIDELAEANPKVKDLKPEEVMDLGFLAELERTGFIAEMRRRYSAKP